MVFEASKSFSLTTTRGTAKLAFTLFLLARIFQMQSSETGEFQTKLLNWANSEMISEGRGLGEVVWVAASDKAVAPIHLWL